MHTKFGKSESNSKVWISHWGPCPIAKFRNDIPKILNAIRRWILEGK